jgi:hypothetical protein
MNMHWKRTVAGAGFIAAVALAPPAQAGQPLDLRYDLYIAGLKVFEIGLDGEISPEGYTSSASLRPKGLGTFFSNDETDMRTAGTLAAGKPTPASFEMRLKGDRRYGVSWSGNVPLKTIRSKPLPAKREQAVNAALDGPLTDPLTVVMQLALSPNGADCALSQRIYNGKEVYELGLSPAGQGKVEGVYAGPVKRCKLSYRTIAGFSDKVMQKNRKNPPEITLMLAPVAAKGGKPMTLIVGASGSIDGNTFTARLAKASLAGAPLKAAAP